MQVTLIVALTLTPTPTPTLSLRYADDAFPRGAPLRGFLAAYAAHAPGGVTVDALADEVRLRLRLRLRLRVLGLGS
jgi:hypothetical protein